MLGYRPIIKQKAEDGRKELRSCITKGTFSIKACSANLSNTTNLAIDRGQLLLDDLGECSRKNGLAVITCYRNIIATDVIPVKHRFLEALKAHKQANLEVVEIRKVANACIDESIKKYRDLMEKTLKEALSCS